MEQRHCWSKFLPRAEFSFNTGFHSSAGSTPLMLVYGRDPPIVHPFVRGETRLPDLEHQLIERDEMVQLLKTNLLKAQQQMVQQANTHRHELTFEAGDKVLLCIQPYSQQSLAHHTNQKISPCSLAPTKCCVASEWWPMSLNYHPHPKFIRMCSDTSMETIGHISHLGAINSLESRPTEQDSWEDYDLLKQQFPPFGLEDESNDTIQTNVPKPWQTYSRRKKKPK
ncbi:hypothetical protein LIER_28218 [Lithospermum erythrorhizon]|uniref:Uncharacterized protein n=1 Tax=Lithospermum erythrorhizon TaxID=34254 RepID=A0AAV3RGU7_LITER